MSDTERRKRGSTHESTQAPMQETAQWSMRGRRVLVTGAGTGIGSGVALAFARAGARVALHYSRSDEGARDTAEQIRGSGGEAEIFQADFNSTDSVRRLAGEAVSLLGGLDVLVNNAGITLNRPFEEITVEQFDTVYGVNIRAMFFLTQACLPHLEQSRGAVINLSSLHAFAGMRLYSVYAGTKGAIVSFTRTLAIELAPRGVRVNAIAPGAVEVENHYVADPGYDPEEKGRLIPAGFVGKPADIAAAALFLASEGARYIIGQTIVVDGGSTAFWSLTDAYARESRVRYGKGYVPEGKGKRGGE